MSIFDTLLERMAAGQMERLYSKPYISLEKGEILIQNDRNLEGSFVVDSYNDVPVFGTVHVLHPAVTVLETVFQGKTILHYSIRKELLGDVLSEAVPCILLCCNGAEIQIPFRKVSMYQAPVQEAEESLSVEPKKVDPESKHIGNEEKQYISGLARCYLAYLRAIKTQEDVELISGHARGISANVKELCDLKPECIRYRLMEAMVAVRQQNVSYAKNLEKRMRNIITSARRQHPTEYCMLRFLQYDIERAQKNYQEAGLKKKQLIDYLDHALEQSPKEAELICLFGEESLNLLEADPMAFWERLHELYNRGVNSPFLYFYGICALQNPSVEQQSDMLTDAFVLRCLRAGARNGMLTREMADRILHVSATSSMPYLLPLYRAIYEAFPERDMLGPLCRMLIRLDKRDAYAFSCYKEAVRNQMSIPRLYDYYVTTWPEEAEEPMNRDILLYYSADAYVNPDIYLKLCVNVLAYYQDDPEIMERYEAHMEAFVRTQLSYKKRSPALAQLIDDLILPDQLDASMAKGILPLLSMSMVSGPLADGSFVVYESEVYETPSEARFSGHKAILNMPGGWGKLHLYDEKRRTLGGISLEITPLIQNEELIQRCRELCELDASLQLLGHARWLKANFENDQEALLALSSDVMDFSCDQETCIRYLERNDLSKVLKKHALAQVMSQTDITDVTSLDQSAEITEVLCHHMDLLDESQAVKGFSYLVEHGYVKQAAHLWSRLPKESLNQNTVLHLAERMMANPDGGEDAFLESILLSLLKQDSLEIPMLSYLAEGGYRPMETQVQILMACISHEVGHQELTAQILERQLMLAAPDWSILQSSYDELANHDQYMMLNHAALNTICHGMLYCDVKAEIDLSALIQGTIIFSGNADALTDITKLAFVKQLQEKQTEAENLLGIRRQICSDLQKKGYLLEFVQREAAQVGLPSYPVITVNLSADGLIKEDMTELIKLRPDQVWAEYRLKNQTGVYTSTLFSVVGCLYSFKVSLFAGEALEYCIHFGQEKSAWVEANPWNYPIRNPQGLSEAYRMLQSLAVNRDNPAIIAETMQQYEVTMNLIHKLGKVL